MAGKVEIKFEYVSPKKKQYPYRQLVAAAAKVESTLKGKVADRLKKEFLKTTRGWKHAPDFSQKIMGGRNITLVVYPAGKYAKRWVWIDQGTARRDISPRIRRTLVFQPDYSPKTTKSGRRGGPGTKSGDYVRTKKVQGHSIEAREFREKIVDDIQDDVIDMLSNALTQGLK